MVKRESEDQGHWVRLLDAANAMGLSPAKVLKRIKGGKLKGSRIGEHWFIYVPGSGHDGGEDDELRESRPQTATIQAPTTQAPTTKTAELLHEIGALKARMEELASAPPKPSPEEAHTMARSLNTLVRTLTDESETIRSEVEFLRNEVRETRTQHAEEMRRKDVLLQNTQDMLLKLLSEKPQEVAYGGGEVAALGHDLNAIRADQKNLTQVLAEMTNFMAVIYRKVKQPA